MEHINLWHRNKLKWSLLRILQINQMQQAMQPIVQQMQQNPQMQPPQQITAIATDGSTIKNTNGSSKSCINC